MSRKSKKTASPKPLADVKRRADEDNKRRPWSPLSRFGGSPKTAPRASEEGGGGGGDDGVPVLAAVPQGENAGDGCGGGDGGGGDDDDVEKEWRCDHTSAGCTFKGTFDDVCAHEDECPFEPGRLAVAEAARKREADARATAAKLKADAEAKTAARAERDRKRAERKALIERTRRDMEERQRRTSQIAADMAKTNDERRREREEAEAEATAAAATQSAAEEKRATEETAEAERVARATEERERKRRDEEEAAAAAAGAAAQKRADEEEAARKRAEEDEAAARARHEAAAEAQREEQRRRHEAERKAMLDAKRKAYEEAEAKRRQQAEAEAAAAAAAEERRREEEAAAAARRVAEADEAHRRRTVTVSQNGTLGVKFAMPAQQPAATRRSHPRLLTLLRVAGGPGPVEASGAAHAGDLFVRVNGQSTAGMAQATFLRLLCGRPVTIEFMADAPRSPLIAARITTSPQAARPAPVPVPARQQRGLVPVPFAGAPVPLAGAPRQRSPEQQPRSLAAAMAADDPSSSSGSDEEAGSSDGGGYYSDDGFSDDGFETWACARCTLVNPAARTICKACAAPRQAAGPRDEGKEGGVGQLGDVDESTASEEYKRNEWETLDFSDEEEGQMAPVNTGSDSGPDEDSEGSGVGGGGGNVAPPGHSPDVENVFDALLRQASTGTGDCEVFHIGSETFVLFRQDGKTPDGCYEKVWIGKRDGRLSEVDATCTQPDDVVLATPQNLSVLMNHFAGVGAVVKLGNGTPVVV